MCNAFTCIYMYTHIYTQVEYNYEQWLMKNMDPLNDNVVQLLTDPMVATLWKDTANIVNIHVKTQQLPSLALKGVCSILWVSSESTRNSWPT